MPIRITDAPEAYDGFGTKTTDWSGEETNKGPVRMVEIQDEHLEWQTMRYSSGMHLCMTPEQWADLKDLIVVED